jgi:hypothetical protein
VAAVVQELTLLSIPKNASEIIGGEAILESEGRSMTS